MTQEPQAMARLVFLAVRLAGHAALVLAAVLVHVAIAVAHLKVKDQRD